MYRVSTYANGEKRWHCIGDNTYPGAIRERGATPDEAKIMQRILSEDAAGEMPDPDLGAAIRSLMAATR